MTAASNPIERARRAYLNVATAEAVVQRERNKLASMLNKQERDQAEHQKLRETEDHDAAIRLVDEDAVTTRKGRA